MIKVLMCLLTIPDLNCHFEEPDQLHILNSDRKVGFLWGLNGRPGRSIQIQPWSFFFYAKADPGCNSDLGHNL